MSYNHYNTCRENYQSFNWKPSTWKIPVFSCNKEISERNKCVDELAKLKENTLRRSNCEAERKSLNELNKNYRAYQEKCKNDYKNLQIRYDNIKNTVCPPCDTNKNSLSGISRINEMSEKNKISAFGLDELDIEKNILN